MINSLNINIIPPPTSAVFFYKRKVLTEKLNKLERATRTHDFPYDCSLKYIQFIKDTKASSGNQIWIISKSNLDVYVYTIFRIENERHYEPEKLSGHILLYDKKGVDTRIALNVFLECVDSYRSFRMWNGYGYGNNMGDCYVCSSEKETLLLFKNYLISYKISFLKGTHKNVSVETKEYRKNLIKKLKKTQKEVDNYLLSL
jgi:hypothetical protein